MPVHNLCWGRTSIHFFLFGCCQLGLVLFSNWRYARCHSRLEFQALTQMESIRVYSWPGTRPLCFHIPQSLYFHFHSEIAAIRIEGNMRNVRNCAWYLSHVKNGNKYCHHHNRKNRAGNRYQIPRTNERIEVFCSTANWCSMFSGLQKCSTDFVQRAHLMAII